VAEHKSPRLIGLVLKLVIDQVAKPRLRRVLAEYLKRVSGAVVEADDGLQVLIGLPAGLSGVAVAKAAKRRRLALGDLAAFRFERWVKADYHKVGGTYKPREGLLGYGNLDDGVVDDAVAELVLVIKSVLLSN